MREELKRIIDKINDNAINVWSDDLEYTTDGIATEDRDGVKYNGWLEDLIKLSNEIR
jgi:hypothetical protein